MSLDGALPASSWTLVLHNEWRMATTGHTRSPELTVFLACGSVEGAGCSRRFALGETSGRNIIYRAAAGENHSARGEPYGVIDDHVCPVKNPSDTVLW